MPAHAALQYSQDGFDPRSREIMGRIVAGETFLRAWIDHAGADPLTAWASNAQQAKAFAAHVGEMGHRGAIAIAGRDNLTPLIEAGALWLADPSLDTQAWRRRWYRQDAWSIVGITHTMSTHAAMDRVAALITAPVQPWDALICTSHAAKRMVTRVLEEETRYLAARLGATMAPLPELPVIPLGVDCRALAHDPAARVRWRAELGIGAEDVAVLQFGRMSFHLKAHPLPLFLALAQAAARSPVRLHLILAGQPTNPAQGDMFRTLAAAFPAITTHFVDGARADAPGVRSAADVFSLLSDNIQETFGLAPVEGMAAGLPVVGSDWDGLRDTIEHGVTGLLIPTIIPSVGTGELIARRFANDQDNYHQYIAAAAQATAVDIAKAADAFAALAADPGLRRRMGAAGRARALALFDWPRVIASYRELLDHLAARRRAGTGERAPRRPGEAARSSRMDPFASFAGHASAQLGADSLLALAPGAPVSVDAIPGGFALAVMMRDTLPTRDTLDQMLAALAPGRLTLVALLDRFPGVDRRQLVSGIAWLLKTGFLTHA